MQDKGSLIKKGFQKAGMTDALTLSMDYLMNENPFDEDDIRYAILDTDHVHMF